MINLVGNMTAIQELTVSRGGKTGGKLPRRGAGQDALPYWPSGNLRGALRSLAHKEVLIAAEQNGVVFGVGDHYMLAQGVDAIGVLSGENIDGLIDAHESLRAANPALSLFGRWKLRSNVYVGSAYPLESHCVGTYGDGFRTNFLDNKPDVAATLEPEQQTILSELLAYQAAASEEKGDLKKRKIALLKELKTAKPEDKGAITQELNQIDEDTSMINKGAAKGMASGIRRPIDGYEAFHAGTEFRHKIALGGSQLELGLFMAVLRRFTREPYIGGHRASGCGEVAFKWDVFEYANDDALTPDKTGVITLSQESGLNIDHQGLVDALAAWDSAKANFEESGLNFKRIT